MNLPRHLQAYIVDQGYDRYTATDHAVWRYILRQCVRVLGERAHPIYLEGLKRTGIAIDAIPRIEDMNAILAKLGWSAVTVDGFIPPSAFMEFQARRVLVITAQMRQLEHLEYTPSPDIVHEAAGHAPIIADPLYADYLARFGVVGMKALASRHDYDLFEAIRRLSALKELPGVAPDEIADAERVLAELQGRKVVPSELSRVSRLHWWTVEYGLVAGGSRAPKLYGAGLLSSLGEAVSCLSPAVAKLPLGPEAMDVAYDITTRQPQLFVARDFSQLGEVLDEATRDFAFRRGGLASVRKAIESGREATCVLSSGIQISGRFVEALADDAGRVAFVKTQGPSSLAFADRELPGHSTATHVDGYSSPVGRVRGLAQPLELATDLDVHRLGLVPGRRASLEYESGIVVEGRVVALHRREGKLVLIQLSDCAVRWDSKVLAGPGWTYDLAVGESIPSVFGGIADRDALEPEIAAASRPALAADTRRTALAQLHARIRAIREGRAPTADTASIWHALSAQRGDSWLAALELFEVCAETPLRDAVRSRLRELGREDPSLSKLVEDGIALVA